MNEYEKYYSETKKDFRKERKHLQSKDRSKYKKTDQDKIKKKEAQEGDFTRGRVLSITLQGILVDAAGVQYICSLKGALKKENTQLKNLVAVGDSVLFSPLEHNHGSIVFIEERKSILSRADNLARKKEQLIAVNIDQVLITVSVVLPVLKSFIVDRYIIAARKGNMEPVIIVNKIDLLSSSPEEKEFYEEFVRAYRNLNISVIPVSTKTLEGMEDLKKIMQGKTSVFSGQSGTGKSSLINAVLGSSFKVGGIVGRTSKGSHTTTTSHLIPLMEGGFCIDTPGIRSFGIWELTKEDIQNYFSEFLDFPCKYLDCSHLNEHDCGVKIAVEENKLSPLRYASYVALMESLDQKHYNR